MSSEENIAEKEITDINTANEKELTSLKGIGPALAQRIISYRDKFGPFTCKEDIMKVKGMGPKKYEALKDVITVD